MTVQEKLFQYYVDRINVYSTILFKHGYLVPIAANDQFVFQEVPNYYTREDVQYIPTFITSTDMPKNIPFVDASEYVLNVMVYPNGEHQLDADFLIAKEALEAFRLWLNDNPNTTIEVGEEPNLISYNITHSATNLAQVGQAIVIGGKIRIPIIIQVRVSIAKGIKLSDNVIELKLSTDSAYPEETLDVYEFNMQIGKESDTEQLIDASTTETSTINKNQTVRYNLKIFHRNTELTRAIIQDLNGTQGVNFTYDLRAKIPASSPTYNIMKTVVLESGSYHSTRGTYDILELNFRTFYDG